MGTLAFNQGGSPDLELIENLLDEFERCWQSASPPDLFEFAGQRLARVSPGSQLAFLTELVRVDMEYRLKQRGDSGTGNERYSIEDYVARLPELESDPEILLDLVLDEYRLRKRHGGNADLTEYCLRFPGLEADLRERLMHAAGEVDQEQEGVLEQEEELRTRTSGAGALEESFPGADFGSFQPGKEFGDYVILQEIARGGMGVVFLAKQRSLNRTVALKLILSSSRAGQEEIARFQMEARAAARLDHPGIVPVYEVGRREGIDFFSMRYVDGPSLAQLVARKPLEPRFSAEAIRGAARAVAYAHQQGVIHRDLKPANILLGADGPVVTDFGVAKSVGDESQLTLQNQVVGTPAYMPPEQARGNLDQIGPASDVYSLGATLYCLLTGRPPFQSASILDTLAQVTGSEPVPVRRLNASVPKDLETVCLKCLRKDPRQRYQTVTELGDELQRILSGETIQARPASSLERAMKWCRRNPLASGLSVALLLLLVTSTVAVTVAFFQTRAALAVAREKERETATALTETDQARQSAEEQTRAADQARSRAEQAHRAALESSERERLARERERLARLNVERLFRRAEASVYAAEIHRAERQWRMNQVDDAIATLQQLPRELKHWRTLGGWEWQYLLNRWRSPVTFSHEEGSVLGVAVSPDGTKAATLAGNEIKVWRLPAGEHLSTLSQGSDWMRDVTFLDEEHLLAVDFQGNVSTWNLKTRRQTSRIPCEKSIVACDLRGASTRVALATTDGEVRVLQVPEGDVLLSWQGDDDGLSAVALDPRGESLAVGHASGAISILDIREGARTARLEGHSEAVYSFAFHPDGRQLVSGGKDGVVRVWDVSTSNLRKTLHHHLDSVYALAFEPSGRTLYSGGADSLICEWDLQTMGTPRVLRGHSGRVLSLQVSTKDGLGLISGSEQGTARWWRLTSASIQLPRRQPPLALAHAGGPGESSMLALQRDGSLFRTPLASSGLMKTVTEISPQASSAGFSLNGKWLAVVSGAGSVQILDVADGNPAGTVSWDAADVRDPQVSDDGEAVAVRTGRSVFVEWSRSADLRQAEWSLKSSEDELVGHAFLHNPSRLLIVTASGEVHEWSFEEGTERKLGSVGEVGRFAVQPLRNLLSVLPPAGQIRVLELGGDELASIQGATNRITAMEFHPLQTRLATGEIDGTIRIWDAANGLELLTLAGHQSAVHSLRWDAGGESLLSVDTSGEVRAWSAQ